MRSMHVVKSAWSGVMAVSRQHGSEFARCQSQHAAEFCTLWNHNLLVHERSSIFQFKNTPWYARVSRSVFLIFKLHARSRNILLP